MTLDRIQCYSIHHELILLDLFTNGDLYNNDSYTSYVDWKIEKTPETDLKKLEFNINKPKTDLKKIEFNINVNNDAINGMNDKEEVHLNDDLAADNIENHGAQHK